MKTTILWLRNTLRIHDNPVLAKALEGDTTNIVVPIYIFDQTEYFSSNSNNRVRFLYEALIDLRSRFADNNSQLLLLNGNVSMIFHKLLSCSAIEITQIITGYSNKPHDLTNQTLLQQVVEQNSSVTFTIVPKANTLTDIESVVTASGFKEPTTMRDMLKLFAGIFPKAASEGFDVGEPLKSQFCLDTIPESIIKSVESHLFDPEKALEHLKCERDSYFKGGETEALIRLEQKVSQNEDFVRRFRKPKTVSTNQTDNPNEPDTTGLSPYISYGCLSPRTLWKACEACYQNGEHSQPPVSLHGQLLFREMFYILSRSVENWDKDTNNRMCKKIEWGEDNKAFLDQWENGQTGFPYIDSMMRQLDATGWMHHLGRHAVSCFLTRGQLWQHWKRGRDVFDKKLLDADWALNNGNWLWLAGVAPFSMPYFRLYNPCPNPKSSLNAETEHAAFVRYWVPELKNFPVKYIYEPHLAPLSVQEAANCIIGKDYPAPIVNRKAVAKENLAKFKSRLLELKLQRT